MILKTKVRLMFHAELNSKIQSSSVELTSLFLRPSCILDLTDFYHCCEAALSRHACMRTLRIVGVGVLKKAIEQSLIPGST